MEFNTLAELESYIADKFTPDGGTDDTLISAEELLKAVRSLKEFILMRGVLVLNSTADIANTSGNETHVLIVKNVGLFVFNAISEGDGLLTFDALDGGAFEIVSRFPPKTISFSINTGAPTSVVIPAGYTINKMTFVSALGSLVQIGLTAGGSEIESDIPVPAGQLYPYLKPLGWLTDTTLYFSGASAQVIIKIIFD